MSSIFSHSKKLSSQAAFGLIELMVSITIISIVSAVIMVKQNSFNGGVLLRSQAYEVALAAREVQLNAVSAVGDAGDFRTLQGLHFDTSSVNNDVYKIFIDADGDGFFDTAESAGPQGVLDSRFEIHAIRVGGVPVIRLSAVFERPNFDARFFTAPNSEVNVSSVEIDIARIGTSATSCGVDYRTIEITNTGQIIVKECS